MTFEVGYIWVSDGFPHSYERTPTSMKCRARKTWRISISGSGFQTSSGSLKVRWKSKTEDNPDWGGRKLSSPLFLVGMLVKTSGVVVDFTSDPFDGYGPGNRSKVLLRCSLLLRAGVGVTVKRRVPNEHSVSEKSALCFI